MRVRVRNLGKYQHYSKRRPPWLKLHRTILDNDYSKLPATAWRLGLEIALMCSEAEDETIEADTDSLSWRLRRKIRERDVKALVDAAFLTVEQDASKTLATCLQRATSETETEAETKQRTNTARSDDRAALGFNDWWETYRTGMNGTPLRDKAKCEKFWRGEKLSPKSGPLIAKLEEQVQYRRDCESNGTFCPRLPDPIRYLKRRLWHEEIT